MSGENSPRRIGIFGGTFDPLHCAHLDLARAAMQQARLDRVLFVVSALPPHKRGDVCLDAEARYEIVAAALEGMAGFEASHLELDREGPSYTADTLAALQQRYPGAELFLILGMDAVQDLPQWHRPENIVQRATVLAARRPGSQAALPALLRDRVQLLDFVETPVSSTAIRRRLKNGEAVDGMVPEAALAVIEKKGWYRDCPERAEA
jgi:nicotinate-nucleotide adenylyltransferase